MLEISLYETNESVKARDLNYQDLGHYAFLSLED